MLYRTADGALRGCTCLKCTNKTVKCTNFLSVVNIPTWMVHLRQVHPLKKALRNRNKKAAGHVMMSGGYTLLYKVLSGGALVSSAPTKLSSAPTKQELLQYYSVGALETSAPPESTV